MASRAIYAGSFDPPTNGHVDIIRRGRALFDGIVVAVGNNPAKKYLFDLEERAGLLRDAIGDEAVKIVPFSGLLVHTAAAEGATVILRGVRAIGDFDLEFRYGLANRDLSGIETVFLLADPAQMFVSSSLIKEIASNGGDVGPYVPAGVLEALGSKYGA